MPPQTENFFTHRKKKPRCYIARRDADFVCEMHTAFDAKNFTSFPRLLGCLVTCGAARILSDPPAQVDDASDTRPFHVDAKGRGDQTTRVVVPGASVLLYCVSHARRHTPKICATYTPEEVGHVIELLSNARS